MSDSIFIVGYLALFVGMGLAFVFAAMSVGRFVRPHSPSPEKLEIYECGEPAIGSSFVQFDLRFYVIALVFIIFDVEVAFLFPWATVFGKVNLLRDDPQAVVVQPADEDTLAYSQQAAGLYRELGVRDPQPTTIVPTSMLDAYEAEFDTAPSDQETAMWIQERGLDRLTWLAAIGAGVFFVILLIGLAYEWATGALDWVRALTEEYRASARSGTAQPADSTQSPLKINA